MALLPSRTTLALAGIIAVCLPLSVCASLKAGEANRDKATIERAHKTMAEARTTAAQDASAIRDRADARDQQIDQFTQETTDAIRNAPDDAAAGDHGLRSLCKLYPDRDPRCRMQQPSPGRVG